jgi:hypothetical protein
MIQPAVRVLLYGLFSVHSVPQWQVLPWFFVFPRVAGHEPRITQNRTVRVQYTFSPILLRFYAFPFRTEKNTGGTPSHWSSKMESVLKIAASLLAHKERFFAATNYARMRRFR